MKTAQFFKFLSKPYVLSLVIGILVCAVFFLPKDAFGYFESQQGVISTATSVTNDGIHGQYIGSGHSGRLKQFRLYVSSSLTGSAQDGVVVGRLSCFTDTIGGTNCPGFSSGALVSDNSAIVDSNLLQSVTFSFESYNYDLNPSYIYGIDVLATSNWNYPTKALKAWGSTSNELTGTDEYAYGSGLGSVIELGFIVETESQVYFSVPPHSPNSTSTDFAIWRVCINPLELEYDEFYFAVDYWDVTDTGTVYTDDSSASPFASSLGQRCLALPKSQDLAVGSYNAEIRGYVDGVDTLISELYSFEIIAGDQTQYMQELSSGGDTESFECGEGNFAVVAACKAMRFLFVPSTPVLSNFTDNIDAIKGKFPFAYLTDVSNAYESITEGSAEFPEFALNMTSNEALPLSVTLFDEATVTEYAGETNVALFRGLMEAVLYIGFGMFVFFSLKGLH